VTVTLYIAPPSLSLIPTWSSTAITCSVIFPVVTPTNNAASCADSVHTVSVTAGDTAYYQVSAISLVASNQNLYVTASLGSS
jgi:hypothetical protein